MALTQEDMQRIREEEEARKNIRKELNTGQKSITKALIWTVLFGCFGLFYVSPTVGIIGSILGILMAAISGGILGPVVMVQDKNTKQ